MYIKSVNSVLLARGTRAVFLEGENQLRLEELKDLGHKDLLMVLATYFQFSFYPGIW